MKKNNFFQYVLNLLLALVFFFLWYFSFWIDYYLEYADIPWTDTITFYGLKDWNSYAVWVDTGNIYYVTGSDNKIHSCFSLVWTGYTEKLGEIYFGYEWQKTYICDDYKLRGVFKIWAGWWWECEDKDDKWKLYLMRKKIDWYFYHDDWAGWTWQARLDWIGFSNWNTVKTSFDLQQAYNNIKIIAVSSYSNLIADWTSTWNILLKFLYPNPKDPSHPYVLKNFSFDKIFFYSGFNSDVEINGKKTAGFKYIWWLTTNSDWIITWQFIAYHPGKNLSYWLKFKIWKTIISVTWNFINEIYPPFLLTLQISSDNSLEKKLIWYKNKAYLDVKNVKVNNLNFSNFSSSLNLNWYNDYFNISTGNNIKPYQQVNLEINYNSEKFYENDSLPISYDFNTNYYFKLNWDEIFVKNYKGQTTKDSIYKYWKVNLVNIVPDSNSNVPADWKSIFWYKVKFLNPQNYPVNNLSFAINTFDNNKYFDLKPDNSYQTWYFILTSDESANCSGVYKLWVISYKPIPTDLSAYLTGIFKNIKYNWHYSVSSTNKKFILNNLKFLPVTSFTKDKENKVIPVNKSTNIKLNYSKLSQFVKNWKYIFTGYIYGCSSCWFKKGKVLENNSFWDKNFEIYLTWWTNPEKLVYSWFLIYELSWDYWEKDVYYPYQFFYDKFLFVWWGSITVLGNILTNKKILHWLNYISTVVNPYVFKNKLRKYFFTHVIRWTKANLIDSDTSIDLGSLTWLNYLYKCSNNHIVSIGWYYNHNINLYFLDCQVNIKSNIISSNKSNLRIISLASIVKNIDYSSPDWWEIPWNIYIGPNVDTIQADLVTDGSILTYADDLNKSNIFLSDRGTNDNLKRQLFINGKIFSKNTIWGGLQNSNSRYLLPQGKYVSSDFHGLGLIPAAVIAQAYDMKFWRNSFLKDNGTYSTGNLSSIIYNKYHCTWNKNNDSSPLCYTTIVILDSNY